MVRFIDREKIYAGCDIVMAGWAGLEGTVDIIKHRRNELLKRYPAYYIDAAAELSEKIPEFPQASEANVLALCEAGQEGVLGALWELSRAAGMGTDTGLSLIPVRQETAEVCEAFSLNPLRLCSAGCFIAASKDGPGLCRELREEGLNAVCTGKFVSGIACTLRKDTTLQYITPPCREKKEREKYLALTAGMPFDE